MSTQVTRWNPFNELEELQNRMASVWRLDRFGGAGKGESVTVAEWAPRVDVTEDAREFLIKAELPEMSREEVKVSVKDGALRISGEHRFEKEHQGGTHRRIKREYGAFSRILPLPAGTSWRKLSADFRDGVLNIHLPKAVGARRERPIRVRAG